MPSASTAAVIGSAKRVRQLRCAVRTASSFIRSVGRARTGSARPTSREPGPYDVPKSIPKSLLCCGMIVLEPATLDGRGVLLLLLTDEPLAPVVELLRLERLLLRCGDRVAVLAILGGQVRLLGLRKKLRRGGRGHYGRANE